MANGTTNVGFEDKLWLAADKLRGSMDASEYKHVVLGLIFLKFVSDSFNNKYEDLIHEAAGFEEDKDEYTADNIFYIPMDARWSTLQPMQLHQRSEKLLIMLWRLLRKKIRY